MTMIPCGGFGIGNGPSVEKDEFGRPVLNASGGSGGEVVTVTVDYDSGTVTMDKTFEEILSLDNPRFVSDDGSPYSIGYIGDDGLQLYVINFNNIGRPEETTMYVEVIDATSSNIYFNSGEYKLTEN